MRLTQWTDYTLRVLMYCAAAQGRERPVTITEIAQAHDISRSHLTKIVQALGAQGLLDNIRGRGGGIRLLKPADQIGVGDVVRLSETDFTMVECFDPVNNQCRLVPRCRLKSVLAEAIASYFDVLDRLTLADLVHRGTAPGSGGAQPVLWTGARPAARKALARASAQKDASAPARSSAAKPRRRPTT